MSITVSKEEAQEILGNMGSFSIARGWHTQDEFYIHTMMYRNEAFKRVLKKLYKLVGRKVEDATPKRSTKSTKASSQVSKKRKSVKAQKSTDVSRRGRVARRTLGRTKKT